MVSKVCRKLLDKIVRPSLAVPYVVALGKRNLLWDLLPDHIEEHILEMDHTECVERVSGLHRCGKLHCLEQAGHHLPGPLYL